MFNVHGRLAFGVSILCKLHYANNARDNDNKSAKGIVQFFLSFTLFHNFNKGNSSFIYILKKRTVQRIIKQITMLAIFNKIIKEAMLSRKIAAGGSLGERKGRWMKNAGAKSSMS